MTRPCDLLTPYVDGELEAAEAEQFALHLDACPTCPAELHDAMQLVALEAAARGVGRSGAHAPIPQLATGSTLGAGTVPRPEPSAEPIPITRARKVRRSWAGLAAASSVAVAAAIAAIVLWPRGGPGPGDPGGGGPGTPIAIATGPTRSIEGRFSYRGAAVHRPYAVQRAGSGARPAESISYDTMSKLERAGDLHGLGAAQLLLGDAATARATFERAGSSPDVDADRALALLAAGDPGGALVILDGVLARAPDHPAARWNRALALRELELPTLAIEAFNQAFEAAAALGEPGWSAEAAQRAAELAASVKARRAPLDEVLAAGAKLPAEPTALTPAQARAFPGESRSFFYEAVRGAGSAADVRALLPLARELDTIAGSDHLARYVERIARADFAVRAPLAARYRALLRGERLDEAAGRAYLAALRAARQDDLVIGALFRTSPSGREVPAAGLAELRRLADASGDPWLVLLATDQEALARVAAHDHEGAEVLALRAAPACQPWLEYRCTRLETTLAQSYAETNRLTDAQRVTRALWARARRNGDWYLERRILQRLANLESLAGERGAARLAVARAYTGELRRRNPELCGDDVWGRELIAMMLVNRQDFAGAKRELDEAARVRATCPAAQPQLSTVFVEAEVVQHTAATPAEVAALRARIAELGAGASAAERAMLQHAEGRALIGRDPAAATALLEAAIAGAAAARPGDVLAEKARSFSYAVLALEAARGGDWARVWKLLGDEAGFAPPARCALGVAVDDLRALAVIRDARGAIDGRYAEGNAAALHAGDPAALVPAELRAKLAGCAEVEVLARAPIHGRPGLLGPDVAWSYRSGRTAAPAPGPAAGEGAGERVVIANTEPPSSLGLPRLLPWRSALTPDRLVEGGGATPSRALAELAAARYAEVHAHGMVDAGGADAAFLTMSPEADGRYALTAEMIRRRPLRHRPIVVLAACHAANTAPFYHRPWSLPAAFVDAGARAVIASPGVIEDLEAGAFFDQLRAQLDRGTPPAIALRDVRNQWLATHPRAAWVGTLMVFQ